MNIKTLNFWIYRKHSVYLQQNIIDMKKILWISTIIIVVIISLSYIRERITQCSEQKFRMRTTVYTIGDKLNWSKDKCDSIIEIKSDSIANSYFPIIGKYFL